MKTLFSAPAITGHWRRLAYCLGTALLTVTASPYLGSAPAAAALKATCQATPEQISKKNNLRQAATLGDSEASDRYKELLASEAKRLQECRSQNWPGNQAIWLRLYPCDANPGVLEAALDRIVDKGYNQVYVEVFYDGQVLLPQADNPTPWPSVVRSPGFENVDLLAQSIAKGRERGLKVYAWLFTMNFGYTYGQRQDRQEALARNGEGQTTLSLSQDATLHDQTGNAQVDRVFIDPYSPIARRDYSWLVSSTLKRKPDGVLFDYVRYMRGTGAASVVGGIKDLWIYGSASKQRLWQRGLNQKGTELIRRYFTQGHITAEDIQAVDNLYSNEGEPLWQGRRPPKTKTVATAAERQPLLQWELWYLSVAHAVQGVLDFVNLAFEPVRQQGIPGGVVFFPYANRPVGNSGYDSRLQAWDRFPSEMEWHSMAYGNCGNTKCIVDEIQRVLRMAAPETEIVPALAGYWGKSEKNRPSLEQQMFAVQRLGRRINSVSHFAYSWQEPESDNERRFCQLKLD